MEFRHLQWSATACDYPGAGVYFGLSIHSEHLAVARRLTPRQMKTFAGGTVSLRADGPLYPFNYFAVRDPSTVSVKPINRPPLANGFRHVKLAFNFERAANADTEAATAVAESARRLCGDTATPSTSAFVVTIGLPMAREEAFFHEAILKHPGQAWEDFYHLMSGLGRLDTTGSE